MQLECDTRWFILVVFIYRVYTAAIWQDSMYQYCTQKNSCAPILSRSAGLESSREIIVPKSHPFGRTN